jgi:hypothetical protein
MQLRSYEHSSFGDSAVPVSPPLFHQTRCPCNDVAKAHPAADYLYMSDYGCMSNVAEVKRGDGTCTCPRRIM